MGAKFERVSDKVHVRTAGGDSIYDGWGANQGFVSTSQGAVVVDTGFTLTASSDLLRRLRRSGSTPVRLVVNTHDHSDHVFGNCLLEEESPPFLAHSACRARLVEQGRGRLEGYRRVDSRLRRDLVGIRIVPQQITYDDDFELTIGQTLVRFIHPRKGAHTLGDTMVYLPDERLLFAGDVVWVHYHPNLEDANIEGWLDALGSIARMKVETIVPGHGRVAGRECLAPLARYLREFDSGMRKLAGEGMAKDEVTGALRLPGAQAWKLRPIVARNVDLLYESYRALGSD